MRHHQSQQGVAAVRFGDLGSFVFQTPHDPALARLNASAQQFQVAVAAFFAHVAYYAVFLRKGSFYSGLQGVVGCCFGQLIFLEFFVKGTDVHKISLPIPFTDGLYRQTPLAAFAVSLLIDKYLRGLDITVKIVGVIVFIGLAYS